MKIINHVSGIYLVFKDEYAADRWRWLLYSILRRRMACFGGYFNSWCLYKRSM